MRARDEGFSLLELMIALTIGMVVLGLVMLSLSTFLQTGYDGVATGQANDRAALALTALRRQVVNADIVYAPTTTGFSVLLLTALEKQGSWTTFACAQWHLAPTGTLYDLTWANGQPRPHGTGNPVATGIVNPKPSTPPFTLDLSSSAFGHRILKVDFVLPETTQTSGTTLSIQSSITALDGQFYAPTAPQFCATP